MCQCTPPDGNRSSLCKTASHSFWCLKKCSDFCQTLYDAVSARYTSIHDCYRHEPFYQCTGLFHNRDVFRGNRCNRKHSPGSALYFYLPSGRKRCSGRHCIVTDFICTVCVSFSAPQSGDQSPPASKKWTFLLHSSREKYHQPRYIRFYHAAHQQSRLHLLQSCTLRHRWRCVRLCHDNCLKCPPDGGNSDLCDHGRFLPNHKLQLWCPPPRARQKSRHHDGSYGARLYRPHVERDHSRPGIFN